MKKFYSSLNIAPFGPNFTAYNRKIAPSGPKSPRITH